MILLTLQDLLDMYQIDSLNQNDVKEFLSERTTNLDTLHINSDKLEVAFLQGNRLAFRPHNPDMKKPNIEKLSGVKVIRQLLLNHHEFEKETYLQIKVVFQGKLENRYLLLTNQDFLLF